MYKAFKFSLSLLHLFSVPPLAQFGILFKFSAEGVIVTILLWLRNPRIKMGHTPKQLHGLLCSPLTAIKCSGGGPGQRQPPPYTAPHQCSKSWSKNLHYCPLLIRDFVERASSVRTQKIPPTLATPGSGTTAEHPARQTSVLCTSIRPAVPSTPFVVTDGKRPRTNPTADHKFVAPGYWLRVEETVVNPWESRERNKSYKWEAVEKKAAKNTSGRGAGRGGARRVGRESGK